MSFTSVEQLEEALAGESYLADRGLAVSAYLALTLRRPLLLEGEPGTGKTALAEALAEALDLPLVRLQCYEGIDSTQALYDWDFPRQLLHLRAAEGGGGDERSVYDRRFLIARPILRALEVSPAARIAATPAATCRASRSATSGWCRRMISTSRSRSGWLTQ